MLTAPSAAEGRTGPDGHATRARVERVVHLGFEVRVELALEDGTEPWARVTRHEAEELALESGIEGFARPGRSRTFVAS